MKIHLLIIDPQYDFCNPNGALFVPGSVEDMNRLSSLILSLKEKITKIHVSLDNHHCCDIAHPIWFVDSNGNHPEPFTQIKAKDLENGVFTTTDLTAYNRTLLYLNILESEKKHTHTIWPYHCLIGSKGASIVDSVRTSLFAWERDCGTINFIIKGTNRWTEHYSAIKAEQYIKEDKSTDINLNLIELLESADKILIAGEAGSHCVANTCLDLSNKFINKKSTEKMIWLEDTISSVSGFENLQLDILDKLKARGMSVLTTKQILERI